MIVTDFQSNFALKTLTIPFRHVTPKPRVGMYRKSVNRGGKKAMKVCFKHFRSKFKKFWEELSRAQNVVVWVFASGARVTYNLSHKMFSGARSTELQWISDKSVDRGWSSYNDLHPLLTLFRKLDQSLRNALSNIMCLGNSTK